MDGEIISLNTAQKLALFENYKKAIYKALEILSKINYEDKTEYIPPREILPAYEILKGVTHE